MARRALALALAFVSLGVPAARAQAPTGVRVGGVAVVGLTVSDMDRSVDFFSKVLTFQKVSDAEVAGEAYEHLQGVFGLRTRVVRMKLGDEQIELMEYLAPRGRSMPEDSRSNDGWFQHVAIVVSDMGKAYERLREFKVRHASAGPQRLPDWNKDAGGIEAFYFNDPDGHALEILHFPPDKGDRKRWKAAAPLFLGIDHTAITVRDTETSLRFYRDALGLSVAGNAENYGTEQEHLNNVFGARLRITALRGAAGPGIELLEYLAPRDGRPYPPDLRSNDIAFWQTTLTVGDAGRTAGALFGLRVPFVSPGAVSLPDADLGFSKGLLVRDPDGHATRLVQP